MALVPTADVQLGCSHSGLRPGHGKAGSNAGASILMLERHLDRRRRRQRSLIAVWLTAVSFAFAAAPFGAMVPRALAAGLTLEVGPETASARTGVPTTLTASVRDAAGDGVDGVQVDFEVTAGPGDDDIGSAGDTPTAPDLSCTTSGGGAGVPATCSVSYTEADNTGGTDAIRAWIDADGSNGTVEADLGEGRDESTAAVASCAAGTAGGGLGWSGGLSLGVKLARPDRNVVQIVGDGSFYFSTPLAVFATA